MCVCDTLLEYAEKGINPATEELATDMYDVIQMVYWWKKGETTEKGWYLALQGDEEKLIRIKYCPFCGDSLFSGAIRKEKRLL